MALKCLNNAVWDQPKGQISFVKLGGLDMLVGLLQVKYTVEGACVFTTWLSAACRTRHGSFEAVASG